MIDEYDTPIAIDYVRSPEIEQRRELEREILAFFECPKCGDDDPPFLDVFDLQAWIECDCGHADRLAGFISEDINA